MRKAPLVTALLALAVVLTACASGNNSGNGTTGNGSSSGNSFRSGTSGALTPEAKLALGTIKLEGTSQKVDSKTAAKLIPLWQLMVQLHSSSSAAPQEVAAVMDEIKATMAPAQVTTIEAMSFTQADVFALLQSEAQANSSNSTGGSGSNGFTGRNRQGGREFFFVGGPGGPGGPPGDFGGGGFRSGNGNGSNSTNSQADPSQAAQAAQARENAISSLAENQLIRLLEAKLGRPSG